MQAISSVVTPEETDRDALGGETEIADDVLLDRVRQGDDDAFRTLVHRYSPRLYSLVTGMLRDRDAVEDVLQEVFFKVHRKLPTFEGKSSFYTWLYRVAVNTATDRLKKKKSDRIQVVEDVSRLDTTDTSPPPPARMDQAEMRATLAEAVASLPHRYRNILVLREYEGCSYEEIARILKCSKGTVESRLFRARARLREKMKQFLR